MKETTFDPQWVYDAREGNQDAITSLYEYSYQNVYLTVKSMIRSDEDTVLDLLQDSYIKAFQSLDTLDNPERFNAWVKRIARNTTLDHLKKSKVVLFTELSGEDEDTYIEIVDTDISHLPDAVADQKETARLLKEILDSLPEGQRAAVAMHYYQDMSIKEIAEAIGRSEGTVKAQLSNARKSIEIKVRELEKKGGFKLYSIAPLPFVVWAMQNLVSQAVEPNAAVLSHILQGTGSTAAAAAAGTGTARAAGRAISKKLARKIIAGALAASVAVGGGVTIHNAIEKDQSTVEVQEIDLSETYYKVRFKGENGSGVAYVSGIHGYSFNYKVEPETGLSNGETVKLIFSAPNGEDFFEYCIEHYGFRPTSDVYEKTVTDLDEDNIQNDNADTTGDMTEQVSYGYESLLNDYYAIICGELSRDNTEIDLTESSLWLTPEALPRTDEDGYFISDGASTFYYTIYDINNDGIDELLVREDSRSFSKILDIFTMDNGLPTWLISCYYRNDMCVCENGFIRNIGFGGAETNTYRFFAMEGGTLRLVETTKEDWGEYSIDDVSCNEQEFQNVIDKYIPIDMEYFDWAELSESNQIY